MGRPLQGAKWFSDFVSDTWKTEGSCGGSNFSLPWASDTHPSPQVCATMAAICEHCPVRFSCAEYALSSHGGAGASGGFYAGVFIPWVNESGSMSIDSRAIKAHSRTVLRRLLRTRPAVIEPDADAEVSL